MEERPSITYADVGGCKEQIEKLREVVELPLLEVSPITSKCFLILTPSPSDLPTLVSSRPRVSCSTAPQVPERRCVLVPSQTEQTVLSSEVRWNRPLPSLGPD